MLSQGLYNSPDISGQSFAIERTFIGSTVVRIFDDNRKVARPQMPQSFYAQQTSIIGNSFPDVSPGPINLDRNNFRFFSVRASKVGKPIAITIEPPPATDAATPALMPNNAQPAQTPTAFVNDAYFPFPPNSPREFYRPTSFRLSNGSPAKTPQDRYLLNEKEEKVTSTSSSSSSSSSDSSDEEAKKIFHYIEFALVSILVNPLFGIVALLLSISSRMKAKKKKYGEAVWEGRFSLMTGIIGIFITILVVVLVVVYYRTNAICTSDC